MYTGPGKTGTAPLQYKLPKPSPKTTWQNHADEQSAPDHTLGVGVGDTLSAFQNHLPDNPGRTVSPLTLTVLLSVRGTIPRGRWLGSLPLL